MLVVLVSSRRIVAPFGLGGGAPGAAGRQWVERADGTTLSLAACAQIGVGAGDVLTIETPGGGGMGEMDAALQRVLITNMQ